MKLRGLTAEERRKLVDEWLNSEQYQEYLKYVAMVKLRATNGKDEVMAEKVTKDE